MARPSRYPDEFRREAVQMALATNGSWASIARRLGVNETTLRNWVHDHMAEAKRSENPLALKESEFVELCRLRRENKELRLENEILRVFSHGRRSGLPLPVRRRVPRALRSQAAMPSPGSLPIRLPLKRNERYLRGKPPTEH